MKRKITKDNWQEKLAELHDKTRWGTSDIFYVLEKKDIHAFIKALIKAIDEENAQMD